MTSNLSKQKLAAILSANFPNAAVKVEQTGGTKKLGGMVTWSGFSGVEQVDRQRRKWAILKKALSPEEQLKITAILAMAPVETLVG